MALDSLNQLRNLALNDDVLRVALCGAVSVGEIQSIAGGSGITLTPIEAEQFLIEGPALESALNPEELVALSQGLSDTAKGEGLSDQQLEGISGGQAGAGEAFV